MKKRIIALYISILLIATLVACTGREVPIDSDDIGSNSSQSTNQSDATSQDDNANQDDNTSQNDNAGEKDNDSKVNFSDFTELPNNIKKHFESDNEKYRFDSDTWYIRYEGPEIPMMGTVDGDGNAVEQAPTEDDRLSDFSPIGVILDITQEPAQVEYIHPRVKGVYDTLDAGKSIMDSFMFGNIILIKYDEDGNITAVNNVYAGPATDEEQVNKYWKYLDSIKE